MSQRGVGSDRAPNILFIMADQFRHDFFGASGADFVRTPNIDSIAARGMRFTQCVTSSPLCAPARIALATGQHPTATGCLSNADFLPQSLPTYYHRLRDADYRVGCVGKLDLAKSVRHVGRYGDRPRSFRWGFTHPEECEGKMHAGMSPDPVGPYTHYLQERGLLARFYEDYCERARRGYVESAHDSVLPADAFEDAYIGRRAAEWIRNVPDDYPWHYFVSFVGPHDPFDPPVEYAERYRDTPVPQPITDDLSGKPRSVQSKRRALDPDLTAHCRRQYCAAISLIDDHIGRILQALAERGMRDNTIVVFSSDHGEMLGDHDLFNKSVPYEASIRVPLVVAGPGVNSGTTSSALVELSDLNPALCELAGLPPQDRIDASSFASVLTGEAAAHRGETVSSLYDFEMIRTGSRKYVRHLDGTEELYNLEHDPDELTNVIDEEPGLASELASRMKARLKQARQLV